MSGDEVLQRALAGLRAEYLADGVRRVAEWWRTFARVQNGDAAALESLQVLAHRLAGSGGGYGFPDITSTARAVDAFCRSLRERGTPPDENEGSRLRDLIQGVADAFARAQAPE